MKTKLNSLSSNHLESVLAGCKTYRKPKQKSPVTIIIGIKCVNGMVVACDSRTTDTMGHINDDAEKLHVVKFKDGNLAIVGEAGNSVMSSIAVEQILSLAKERSMNDYRAVALCAEEAVAKVKQKVRTQFQGTAEELQKHFEAYAFELMLAHYYETEPYIFTLDSCLGLAAKKDKLYSSIGCGWQLADFIIARLDLSEFGTGHGMWTAVYAVEEIKKCDSRCGGKTRAAIIATDNAGKSYAEVCKADAAMQEAIDEALSFSEASKAQWRKTADARIHDLIAKRKSLKSP